MNRPRVGAPKRTKTGVRCQSSHLKPLTEAIDDKGMIDKLKIRLRKPQKTPMNPNRNKIPSTGRTAARLR